MKARNMTTLSWKNHSGGLGTPIDFKDMFRKGNSKIYNFPVETEFKFALEEAQNGSTDPMEEFHRPGGPEVS